MFSLLMVFLTVALILALSVLLYCNAMMEACDEAYRSIALVEYMGSGYPNEDEADAIARQAAEELKDETVLSVPGVTAWSRGNTYSGFVEGYDRRSAGTPYGNKSVIIVNSMSAPIFQAEVRYENGRRIRTDEGFCYHTCLLSSNIYAQKAKEGTMIDILTGETDFVPEKGKNYILNGVFVDTSVSARQIGDYPMNGLDVFRVESFLEVDDLPYAEYEGEDSIPQVFLSQAEQYRIMNNYVRVVPCKDVKDVYTFHQNELQLAEGTMPEPGDINSCVISADMAQRIGLKVGDNFTLEKLREDMEDRYYLKPTEDTETFTVSGIAIESLNHYGIIWAIRDHVDAPLFGYTIGTVSLINDQAEEAVETLRELVPDRVRVTLLDQGYNDAVEPFREVSKTATNVLLVSAFGVAAVLLLFAFLFVGRQSDTVRIMVSLGTPRRKISLWFLSGALLICGASAFLGTLIGTIARPAVISWISRLATEAIEGEGFLWYSETSLGIVKQMSFDLKIPLWPNLPAALGIVALAMIFTMMFLKLASQTGTRKKGKSRVRVPRGKTSTRFKGGLRFARLSIIRGGLRSLLVPLVSMILTVTVIFLGGVYQNWQNQLDEALDNTEIDGMVVSLDGRYYSDLTLSITDTQRLREVEGLDDVSVSFSYQYWLPEEMPVFSEGESGIMRRLNWIASQPSLVALNSLSAAKDFYYEDPIVTWMEGWDETMLSETETQPIYLRVTMLDNKPMLSESAKAKYQESIPCVCSASFLESHGMTLGDTFSSMAEMNYLEVPVNLQVVGSYVQSGSKAHIYVPLACYIPNSMLTGGEIPDDIRPKGMSKDAFKQLLNNLTFRTCRFRLTSARELENVRKRLRDEEFSSVRHTSSNRTTLLLRDSAFLKFTENMKRNIAMGRVMSGVISVLIVLMGFIISWLMTFSRRREFALMRGFGAPKGQVFSSFFLEQGILSFIGCIIGSLALFALYAGGLTQPLTVAAYLICYLLGTAVSIKMIGKTDLMELLTVRE